ncbi:amidohydrolase, partial [Candidatus Bathyarchaeota archaeon]
MRMQADTVLVNGKIVTMDEKESIAEAVAIKYGRFLKVGKTAEVEKLIGENTKVIDLKGKTVIPGLIDSHCHMMSVGAGRKLNVDLSEEAGVHSISDLIARLKERADKTPKGQWVLGYQEDDSKLAEKRHPTRWDLDKASTDHPIIISTVGGHFSMANSKAFQQAGVTKDTEDPVGGKFDRDAEGEIVGGLHETAIDMILPAEVNTPSREQSREG